jgi:hypothetical protein
VCIRDWTRDYRGLSHSNIESESDQRRVTCPYLWRTYFNFHLQKRQVALNYPLRGKTQTTAPDLEYAMLCAACAKIYDRASNSLTRSFITATRTTNLRLRSNSVAQAAAISTALFGTDSQTKRKSVSAPILMKTFSNPRLYKRY